MKTAKPTTKEAPEPRPLSLLERTSVALFMKYVFLTGYGPKTAAELAVKNAQDLVDELKKVTK